MGRVYFINLEGKHYSCKFCTTPLAVADDLISQDIHCRNGKGFLLKNVVNVTVGEKQMTTPGLQTSLVDIFCVGCSSLLGWKYENETDKEGQFILDRSKISLPEGSIIYQSPEPQQDVGISERI